MSSVVLGALERLPALGRVARAFRPGYPPVALEIDSERITAVRVEPRAGGFRLAAWLTRALPSGLVDVGMTQANVSDQAQLAALLGELVAGVGGERGPVSLVLPDRAAKLSLVALETRPRRAEEARDLIVWKLKKSTPFKVEDGRLSFQCFQSAGAEARYLVAFAQDSVVGEYEGAARAAGLVPGLIDFVTFNLYNLYHDVIAAEVGAGDALLVDVGSRSLGALIVRNLEPIFYRCKTYGAGMDEEALGGELHHTVLYYQDRLQGSGFGRVYLRAAGDRFQALGEVVSRRYAIRATAIDPSRVVDLGDLPLAEAQVLAPALGAAIRR